jgi:hypothetical protein
MENPTGNETAVIQNFDEIYEKMVIKFVEHRKRDEEQEKRVLVDKIVLYTQGKEVILENAK